MRTRRGTVYSSAFQYKSHAAETRAGHAERDWVLMHEGG